MRKRFCVVALTAALLGTTSIVTAPNEAGAQSLQDEVAQLLVSHPQIRAARKNVAASAEGVNAAFAQYLPTVSAFGDFGYERIDSPGRTSATPNQGPFTTGQARQTSVTITQTLFNGYLNEANNANAKLTKQASEITLEETEQGILFEGVSVYLEVLRNRRLIQLASENESTIQRQFELEDERVRRGAGITLDVLESKKRLQVSKERRVAFEGSLRDSLSRFDQVFGHEPVIKDMVMPTPPLGLVPEDAESAVSAALDRHPAVRNSQARVDLANEQRNIAKAAFYPTIDVVAEWSYEDDLAAVRGSRRDYTAKVQANWDLFNGFATRAGVAQASHSYSSSIDASNFVKRKIAEETRLAWSGLDTARQRVTLLQNAVNIAAEVFSGRRKLREAGKETVINVLDAESQMFDARIQLVAAQHDARVAVYRLLAAMGQLNIDTISQYAAAPSPNKVAAAEPAAETKDEIESAAETETRAEAPTEHLSEQPTAQPEPKLASAATEPEAVAPKAEPKQKVAAVAKPQPKPEPKPQPKPQIVAAKAKADPAPTATAAAAQPVKVESIQTPAQPEKRIASKQEIEQAKSEAQTQTAAKVTPTKETAAKVKTAKASAPTEANKLTVKKPAPEASDKLAAKAAQPVEAQDKLAALEKDAAAPVVRKASLPEDGDPNFMRAWPYE
jgi:adhesin transport system outer membrane protein